LVEANGGQIVAQNRQGGGAVFSIRLPISEAMRLPGAESVATTATAVPPRETIEAEVSAVKAALARVSSAK
jgi:chemotaxis protein histidine kinase CheA